MARDDKKIVANMLKSLERDLPALRELPPHNGKLIICGGGPSIKKHLKSIKRAQRKGAAVFCVNGVLKYLLDSKITPDSCVLCDSEEILETQVTSHKSVSYYVAACCSSNVFDMLKDNDVTLWHSFSDVDDDNILPMGTLIVHGGSTAALRCANIGYMLGYRDFLFYGLDSSYGDRKHVYAGGIENNKTVTIDVFGKSFTTSPELLLQADCFLDMFVTFEGCNIKAKGEGLVPHISKEMNKAKIYLR